MTGDLSHSAMMRNAFALTHTCQGYTGRVEMPLTSPGGALVPFDTTRHRSLMLCHLYGW